MTTSAQNEQASPVRLIVTLMLISAVAGGLLSGVQALTAGPIAEARRQEELSAIGTVLPPFANEPDRETVQVDTPDGPIQCYVGKDTNGAPVGIAIVGTSQKGYGGELKVMVGINMDGTIHNTVILEMQETPGLGDNAAKPAFINQFDGKSLDDGFRWKVQKDGGDVDALTAATITSRAVTEAIHNALSYFEQAKAKVS